MADIFEPIAQAAATAFPSLFEFGSAAAPAIAEGASVAAESAPGWFPATAETLASAAPTAISVGGDIAAGAAPGFASGVGDSVLGGLGGFAAGKGDGGLLSSPAQAATPTTPGEASPNEVVSNAFASLDTGIDGTTGQPTTGMGGGSTLPTGSQMPGGYATAPAGAGDAASPAGGESLDDLLLKRQPGGTGAATPQALAAQPGAATSPTTTAATPTGAGTSKTGGDSSFLGDLASGAKNQVMKNPLGLALGAGGLGYNIFQSKQNQAPAAAPALQANNDIAKQNQATGAAITAEGQQLASYISSGTLPPAFETVVSKATDAAKARAISNAAAQGLPTDPTKNTALATALESIDRNADVQRATLMQQLATTGTQLVNSGVSMSGLSSKIYDALVAQDNKQSADIGKAIANFAAAINPGGSKVAA